MLSPKRCAFSSITGCRRTPYENHICGAVLCYFERRAGYDRDTVRIEVEKSLCVS